MAQRPPPPLTAPMVPSTSQTHAAGMTPEQQLNHNRQVQHLQQLLNTGNLNPQLQAAAAALMRPGAPSLATLLPQLNQPMASQALPAGWRPSASQAPGTALPVARPQMQMPNMMQQQQFQARPSQPMPQQTFQYMQQPRPGYGQSAVPGAGVQPYNLPRPQLGSPMPYRPPMSNAPVPQPLSEEDKRLLPKKSIARIARAAGVSSGVVEPDAEAALMKIAEEWVTTALAFGCGAARRRRSERLSPADVAPYLERTWHLHVPGFGLDTVHPYKRPVVSELHRTRAAAVRRAIADSSARKPAAGSEALALPAAAAKAPVQ